MENILLKQMKAIYEIMGDPELAKSVAKMFKNIVDELQKVGFSQQQAIDIATKFSLNNK